MFSIKICGDFTSTIVSPKSSVYNDCCPRALEVGKAVGVVAAVADEAGAD
jgi:hypothetical protein